MVVPPAIRMLSTSMHAVIVVTAIVFGLWSYVRSCHLFRTGR